MKKSKQVVIDGYNYTIGMHRITRALPLLTRIMGIASPLLGSNNAAKIENVAEADDMAMLSMFGPLIEKLEDKNVTKLLIDILEDVVTYTGSTDPELAEEGGVTGALDKTMIDIHFTGRPFALIKLVWEVVKHNYQDFLKGKSLDSILAKMNPMTPPPKN